MYIESNLSIKNKVTEFIQKVPKAELHIHLEGSIEPETLMRIAERNKINLKYNSVEEVKKAYRFDDLKDFLNIYNQGTKILRTELDFYEITLEYLNKVSTQSVKHVEMFIDFQTYEKRDIKPEIILSGIKAAIADANKKTGITCYLILAFLRQLGAEAALKTFMNALKFKEDIIGIGIAATEIGYPPELFAEVFEAARNEGFRTTAHAGEEGPASYVKGSIDILKVDRIDHGNKAMDDLELIQELIDRQIPLTLCPLSNIALKNVAKLKDHTLKKKLDLGLLVSVNSDDPSYFGGYVNENYQAVASELQLSISDIRKLAENSFVSSFLPDIEKEFHLKTIKDLYEEVIK
ncbi:MAG: adenosine deaminase [Saprospiraceae bacterium]|nr:adenosine deaminase [Saprospiraceae bacterium]